MVDVYIPQDVWTYSFSFIPISKIKYNKVGFYLDQYEKNSSYNKNK